MVASAGLLNTIIGTSVIYIAYIVPFTIWMLRGFVAGVPAELEEAAMVDGLSRTGAFMRITFPLLAPGLVASGVYAFLQAWNEFTVALVTLTTDQMQTLPLWLRGFVQASATKEIDWGQVMAASTLFAVPVIVFFLFVQGAPHLRARRGGGEGMIPADSTGRTPLTVGIDIGGTKTLAIAVDAFGDIVGQVRIPSGYGAENVIAAAVEAVVRLREELPEHRIDRVGIGIPGTVDHESGEVEQALNLGLESVALGAALEARLGVPVHVENDVNAAALGAIQVPSAAGSSLAYLNLGTGLAAGIVLDGRLWRGVSRRGR